MIEVEFLVGVAGIFRLSGLCWKELPKHWVIPPT
jgi:hypothetical protein